ncbi:MAG: thiamine pyrophosphate-dependent enzyme [Thiobacillus sp.]|uniref:thiamine pyrophosphate-dependent enzyme n=1 Tax=Thiobacillus sp. TaxID=924 RepID=UPI0028959D3C|nr:thiamine pyrophosphate-dependent enzyme [Thiobacillus sp.]MDT3707256.1 thiamine pyrophosphate-dependent enzyme [Thiobacillus sp.]
MAQSTRLQLHIPVPAARPGDAPDFSHIAVPPAGLLERPDPLADPDTVRDLAFTLIRVLDDNGDAVGAWAPAIAPATLLAGLRAMVLTRIFDERLYRAQRQGKTSFYMKSLGEEAIPVAQALLLGPADMCFPTYRDLGWLMVRNYPLLDLVNQIFSNGRDPLQGRQLPILYSARAYGFYSLSGNLANRFGHAVGWAMASAYRGDGNIALAHIGEGSTAEGGFHEALTFAGVYGAPVILCIVNNQWAISSFSGMAGAERTTFAAKAIGYGVPGLRVDGNDFLAVWAATQWAAERARANGGPTLIEFVTYRAGGHSTSDDPARYRPADEPAHWPLGDPVARLRAHLDRLGLWDDTRHAALEAELEQAVREAVRQGEASGTLGHGKPSLEQMFEGVFKEPDWRVLEQRRELGI